MDGDQRSDIGQILSAIEYGQLSHDETERRVAALIGAELSKPDESANMELVRACEDLLEELHTHEKVSFESHMEENYTIVKKRFADWQRHKRAKQGFFRFCACAAAVLLCFMGASMLFHWNWIDGESTPSGSQYVVQGHEISVDAISHAIAMHTDVTDLSTQDINELDAFLGFDSSLPLAISPEWTGHMFYCMVFPDWIQITVQYMNEQNTELSLTLIESLFTSPDNASNTFEQDAGGERRTFGSTTVYFSSNEGTQAASWIQQNTSYHMYGNVTNDELICCVEELLGGKRK